MTHFSQENTKVALGNDIAQRRAPAVQRERLVLSVCVIQEQTSIGLGIDISEAHGPPIYLLCLVLTVTLIRK